MLVDLILLAFQLDFVVCLLICFVILDLVVWFIVLVLVVGFAGFWFVVFGCFW